MITVMLRSPFSNLNIPNIPKPVFHPPQKCVCFNSKLKEPVINGKSPDNYSYLQTEVSKKNLSSDYPEFFLFWLKSLETKLKS